MKKLARRISLNSLRQFGWDLWDPIGLKDTDCPRDEYDTYLQSLVSLLRDGATMLEAVEYLIDMETRYIGMPPRANTRTRAERLVLAVEIYMNDIPAGPPDMC